ncbi:MAG: hypothetical protein SGJ24_16265 [Chloroflexota bacterium]|jgi:hypothetical protein|nr:hypothetical protein [Chloroflexota bacterium]
MTAAAALIAPIAVAFALIVMGILSRRLGTAMRVHAYYIGFYAAALMMLISGGARFYTVIAPLERLPELWRLALLEGLPALALTLAVMLAWRYWSWLLAERA